MFLSRNSENIYGYTGKKTPNYNFVSASIQGTYKKTNTEIKPKPVILRNDKPKENPVKVLHFVNGLEEFCGLLYYKNNQEQEIPFQMDITGFLEWIHEPIFLRIQDELIEIMIINHEKGYSLRTDIFSLKINITVNEDKQTIEFSRTLNDKNLRVVESKISFLNIEYPFYFLFEHNPKCDAIFNDFVQTTLPEIRPPNNYTVPVKCTNSLISFREYISYIKTRTFLHFKVDESGWYIDTIEDCENESVDEFVSGVKIKTKSFWVYYPRGTRIEHSLQFL